MFYDSKGYTSLVQAQFSIPFMLATYFLNPRPGKEWFERRLLTDPAILTLAARVHPGPSEPHYMHLNFKDFQNGKFPTKTLTIRTKDGHVYTETMSCHPGHPHNMMTGEEFCDRFRIQASATLDADKLERAVNALNHIEACEDISTLSTYLY